MNARGETFSAAFSTVECLTKRMPFDILFIDSICAASPGNCEREKLCEEL